VIWYQGHIISPDLLRIDVRDETFQHGLGLFETLRTWNGYPRLLEQHLDRMQRSARALELNLTGGQLPDVHAVRALVEANCPVAGGPDEDVRIRITMTGGAPAPEPGQKRSIVWMESGLLTPAGSNGGAIVKRTMLVAADDPLVRHKTLNYWRRRIAHAQALKDGASEVLCVTADGFVCEGARSNIFVVEGRRLITPTTDGPLLPGIMRRVVLDHAVRAGVEVLERRVGIDELAVADEAFLTNSGQGMLPICRLLDRELPAPGPVTHRLWSDVRRWLQSGDPM
jgi:branched-subunit amino acid aminotransferase/4-amino-4-deoxychorismate lyase